MKIAFVGAGHLSLNYGIAAACKGFNVTFFYDSYSEISKLKKKIFPFFEPNFDKTYLKVEKKISYSNKFVEIKKFNLIFLAEDVETDQLNNSKYHKINKLLKNVFKHCSKNACVVILSQVRPGFTRKIKWNKKNLFYQVETLIFGNALERAQKPEQFVIGKYNEKNKINKNYLNFLKKFKIKIHEMNYETAELSKISINLYLISSITFANCVNSLSKSIGADWNKIIEVLKKDKRIGKYSYLKPGLGILSANLMRDLKTSLKISSKKNLNKKYMLFLNRISNRSKNWIQEKINEFKLKEISIFGLTYKENINILKNSPAIEIIKKFKNKKITIFDPKINKLKLKQTNFTLSESFSEFIKNSNNLILLTQWTDFLKKKKEFIKKNFKGELIIDPYGIFKNDFKNTNKIKYLSL